MTALALVWLLAAGAVSLLVAERVQFQLIPKERVIARLHQAAFKNQEREAILKKLFEDNGCTGESLQEQTVKHAKVPNLICTLGGQTDYRILVSAHTDHVSAGDGTVDNWSGASLLPDLYESLHVAPRRHTFVFIGFTREEDDLIGSRFYAKEFPPSRDRRLAHW